MQTISILLCAALVSVFAADACAGKYGGGGSRISVSKVTRIASRPSIKAAATSATTRTTSTGRDSSGSYGGTGRTNSLGPDAGISQASSLGSRMKPARPVSLLPETGPQPSPALAQQIHVKESSSGPGWVGTAFLISMLSNHNLSASDREWVNNRLNEVHAENDDAGVPRLPEVAFHYDLPTHFESSKAYHLTVRAEAAGSPLQTTCTLLGSLTQKADSGIDIEWTPITAGSQILTCEAGGVWDERLLVATSNRDEPTPQEPR